MLRMFEEEGGVAVVRNNSNNEPTPYIPSKETLNPTTDTGGRGGITQGVSFEFFESFLLIYSHNTHWVNFEFFQKLLTTLIKTYPLDNF